MKETQHYINNKTLVKIIVDYQKLCRTAKREKRQEPQMPDVIGIYIMQLCEKIASRWNFSAYTFKDEFVLDAIERCVYAVKKFSIKKTNNAFGYLTQVAWRAMQKRINDERLQNYIKHKNSQVHFSFDNVEANDLSDKVILDFEERERQKKLDKTKKKR